VRNRPILITGGAGFIGSAFARLILKAHASKAIIVDKLTYAGDLKRLEEVKGKYKFYRVDICDKARMERIFKNEKPGIVVHFAAETHVDNSIKDPAPFLEANIKGTHVLLEMANKYNVAKFIHISSDEVYGEIKRGSFSESSFLSPNSPYAASKAAADLLVQAYIRTYGVRAIIVRPSNNYGCWQFPEKLIPVVVLKALKNKKVPVYARGMNIREWLYVVDCAKAILQVVKKGRAGEIYNIGSGVELKNIDIVKNILDILNKPYSLIGFVADRPGHDFRYSLSSSKIIKELGWKPVTDFKYGLKQTVAWYKDNLRWMELKSHN